MCVLCVLRLARAYVRACVCVCGHGIYQFSSPFAKLNLNFPAISVQLLDVLFCLESRHYITETSPHHAYWLKPRIPLTISPARPRTATKANVTNWPIVIMLAHFFLFLQSVCLCDFCYFFFAIVIFRSSRSFSTTVPIATPTTNLDWHGVAWPGLPDLPWAQCCACRPLVSLPLWPLSAPVLRACSLRLPGSLSSCLFGQTLNHKSVHLRACVSSCVRVCVCVFWQLRHLSLGSTFCLPFAFNCAHWRF